MSPILRLPNSATIHGARHFFSGCDAFGDKPGEAILEFHPRWAHLEPLALVSASAWGAWARRQGLSVSVTNLEGHARYAARMRLFEHLGIDYKPDQVEHEESGRFVPVNHVRERSDIAGVIADISSLLHLQDDPESLAAVQYAVSELLRNVLEHSSSPEGAFVCAHRYTGKNPRVSIAVADCGVGIRSHLSKAHSQATTSDEVAIDLALRPGVTGALPGVYGTPDNAGAGLFITRCIAKGTGGYFLIVSGDAGYRQRRARKGDEQIELYLSALDEPRHDLYSFPHPWLGTVVAVEIRTEQIADYQGFFQWIFQQIPSRRGHTERIRFT